MKSACGVRADRRESGNQNRHRGAAETIITFHNCSHKNDEEYCRSTFAPLKIRLPDGNV